MDLMEWSRKIINKIMTKYVDSKHLYYVQVVVESNPLNYDGMDSVFIEIWKKENKMGKGQQQVWLSTGECMDLEEAIEEMNKKIEQRLQ